ncbi:hypothetical protein FSP39_000693 [Pinctada imbricata]|uniref:Uncharacterized protein n=1 Tax=Pinctada imbricata TaxID=66713 RepID=A0AA88YKU8_PINIB|nr:hypothetical protein FSP39_000693 [Pinctada imbricata]
MDHCVICQKSDDQPLICLREKGSNGINDASRKREDTLLTIVGQYVHKKCRESYVNPFNIAKVKINLNKDGPRETPNTPNLRSQEQFDFKTHCLFCGQIARKDRKRTCEVYQVRTDEFQTKILDICKLRGDNWGTEDSEEEKNRIILAAAKLIKSDIRSVPVEREYYPSTDTLSSGQKNLDFVPKGLQHFLRELIPESQLKMTSIGQAIMQASRPRSLIAPLQLGLAVQLHHNFGSRFLLDELNHLGFCSSYAEVQKFESSTAISQGLLKIPGYEETDCLQFIADNVDHNIGTLDGKETFHGMGIVAGK